MKIRFIFTDEKDLRKVQERFYTVAAAHGISANDALREALLFWLHMVPASSDFMLDVTEAEWREIAPVIAQIRERHRGAGPESTREGPAS